MCETQVARWLTYLIVAVRGLWIGAMNIPKGHYIFLEVIKGTTFWYNFRLIFFYIVILKQILKQ
jgi:hypothetical protein